MGWTYPFHTETRAQLIEHLTRPERFNERWELVRSRPVGNNHWYLMRNRETGEKVICLDLMHGGARKAHGCGGWGYKDIDESMGPSEVNCPLSLLNEASEPNPNSHAPAWRERVRKYHADRAAKPKPAPGVTVTYGGIAYQLQRTAGPRRGWVVRDPGGHEYRMNARQLAKAQPVATL